MDSETKQKIEKYVSSAYAAAAFKIDEAAQVASREANARLASRGLALSGVMDHEMIRIHSEKINGLLHARANALLDAYELYNQPFDEFAILDEVAGLRNTLISAISNSAQGQHGMMLLRTNQHDPGFSIRVENFKRQLTINSQQIQNEVTCQIERRRVMPNMTKGITQSNVNIYHLRDNARVNIESIDQSVNTVTREELFTQIRDTLTQQVPELDRKSILTQLDALQQSEGTKSMGEQFSRFMASAADYMTVLQPFIPALTEWLKRSLA